MLMHVRRARPGSRALDLWLPLGLLWPLVLALAALALPLWLVGVAVAAKRGKAGELLRLPWLLGALTCSLPGLYVEVNDPDEGYLCIGIW